MGVAALLAAALAAPQLAAQDSEIISAGVADESADAGTEDSAVEDAGTEDAGTEDAGAEATEPEALTEPTTIYFGVYPLRVSELDMRTGTATITYYVWSRWRGPADGTAYEVMNGTVLSRESEYLYEEGGERYAYYRMSARVIVGTDFHTFPFDEHEIQLTLEHAEEGSSTVLFAVDEDSVRHVESPFISGWIVDRPEFDITETRYATNFGMPGVDAEEVSTFPRFRMRLRLRHEVSTTFFKTFLTLFISVFIAFLGFFMHPDVLDARVGVGVAGMFGAVTSQSVVATNLPDIPYMTLSDKVHLVGILFIFIALVESCAIGFLIRHRRAELATKLDLASRVGMVPAFAVVVALLLVFR